MGLAMRMVAVCLAAALCLTPSTTAQAPVPVVGVTAGIDEATGQRPARININDMYAQGGPQWSLYILALAAFKAVDENDELSYFQISGIHGLPQVAWNGVGPAGSGPGEIGYCPHNELLFPSWHRPYVALFEQVLVSHASAIASQYPASVAPTYLAAAQSLRQPYWDWALDYTLPTAVTVESVTVTGPNGTYSMPNPLLAYQFQNPPEQMGITNALATYGQTVRCPVPGGADVNSLDANPGLAGIAIQLTDQVYDTFTRSSQYETMAYDASGGSSFENPHNGVHDYCGCLDGSMSDIPSSAFDPLFMLHHAQLDRLMALWQAIWYNDTMFTTSATSLGQYATPAGTVYTADSPLKPFYAADGATLHSSNSVASTRTFGYTYPEINDWSTTPDELATSVRARVNALYGAGNQGLIATSTPVSSRSPTSQPDSNPLSPGTGVGGQITRNRKVRASPGSRRGGSRRSTSSRVVMETRAINTSSSSMYYTAELCLSRSEVPLPATVRLAAGGQTAGRMTLLSMPADGETRASLPLQDVLRRLNGVLADYAPETVIPFLQDNLVVTIRRNDGTTVPVSAVPSIRLEVQGMTYVPGASDSDFPSYGSPTSSPVTVRQGEDGDK